MSKKKTDSNHIFYYSQTLKEILDMQLDLNMQEIGFAIVFKAAYIYHKGKIPTNKLCQFCRVFEKQEIFVNFIEKNCEKKGKFYYSKQHQKEVNLIIKNSKRARKSVLNRWKKNNTNVSTNVYTSTSNTNNNVNNNNNNNNSSSLKDKSSEAKKPKLFEEFWQLYTPVRTIKGEVTPKGSKQKAKIAYDKTIKSHNFEIVNQGLKAYIASCQSTNTITCAVSTFLNQERFLDDYDDVTVEASTTKSKKPKIFTSYSQLD